MRYITKAEVLIDDENYAKYDVIFDYQSQSYWEPEDYSIVAVIDEDDNEIDQSHPHYAKASDQAHITEAEIYDEY